jgi:hypothetical protein
MNWQQFFEQWGQQEVARIANDYGWPEPLTTVEEMYQAFKARLIAELAVSAQDLSMPGHLMDKSK